MPHVNDEFSYTGETQYYSRPPTSYPGYNGLLGYLQLLDPDPAGLFAGKRILDIGAGECAFTGLIAEQLRPAHVVALELIRNRMAPAKACLRSDRLHFVQGSCYQLPFANGCFDLVFGNLVLHHLPHLQAVVGEIRRVLTPEGSYVGLEPNFWNPVRAVTGRFGSNSPNEYNLRAGAIRTMFRQHGFGSVHTRYVWRRFPKLHSRLLTSEVAIRAGVP